MAQEVLKHLNRRGDFDADAWIPTALNAIDVFQHALAYNPETRKVETVDHMPINEAITRWPFLGFNINDCDAEGRALGLITPAGAPQELPHTMQGGATSSTLCHSRTAMPFNMAAALQHVWLPGRRYGRRCSVP
eukprot:jgi/Tetstr1/430722/TSEL_020513.t1